MPWICLLAVALGGVTIERAMAANSQWPPPREGLPVPQRPGPDDPPFHRSPLAPTFTERRRLFLEWVAAHPTPPDRNGIWADLCKLELGKGPVSPDALGDALAFVAAREDCADFTVAGLLRLYYKHSEVLTAEQREGIRRVLLDFKYWLDEPNPSLMQMWTENHQILFYSAEYLAGQLFPDETFTNNGGTGSWHLERGRERVLRWIDWHARVGFAEWDSIPYYPKDLCALLNLVDFAADEEVSRRAAMLVDLLLFDIAVDSFYGQYGSSHGRIAARHVKSAAGDSMVTVQALVWGMGRFQSLSDAAVSIATSTRYRLPPVIEAVGQDVPGEFLNYERHSIPVSREEAARYGLSFRDPQDVLVWWGMGGFTHPRVIDLTVRLADLWGLWHYDDFRGFKGLGRVLSRLRLLPAASTLFDPDPNGVLMSEVNKVTYRTPEYMLSCAQDYRKGEKGYQQHIWQATLGPYAVVFSTNPDSLREDDRHRPSYWASNGRFPRAAQYRNVLIALYNIPGHRSLLEARHYAFTHAYFPRWAFDNVREVPASGGGGWIFGQKGHGYVALYSHAPYRWQTEGPDADQEVIAPGRRNVWICQLGRRAVDGTFDEFVARVSGAPLRVRGLDVSYHAPGIGEVSFGWKGPLRVNGVDVPLRGYPRWDNPYCRAEFGSRRYTIEHGDKRLSLDFEAGLREVSGE